MKITYDNETGATYIKLTDEKISKTIEQGSYYIDLDKDGKVVGIEYLNKPEVIGLE